MKDRFKTRAEELEEQAPKLKIPATTGACADLLYQKIQLARQLAKPLKDVEREIAILEQHLIDTLPADDAEGVVGKKAKVVVNRTEVASVKAWQDLYAFIVGQGLAQVILKDRNLQRVPRTPEDVTTLAMIVSGCIPWDLLQRRVSSGAVLARKADGVLVPGTETLFVKRVSCTKR